MRIVGLFRSTESRSKCIEWLFTRAYDKRDAHFVESSSRHAGRGKSQARHGCRTKRDSDRRGDAAILAMGRAAKLEPRPGRNCPRGVRDSILRACAARPAASGLLGAHTLGQRRCWTRRHSHLPEPRLRGTFWSFDSWRHMMSDLWRTENADLFFLRLQYFVALSFSRCIWYFFQIWHEETLVSESVHLS